MTERTLSAGEPVDVHEDLGCVLGKSWSKGRYTFEKYEAPEDHPLARVGLAPREPTCLVRCVGGLHDGLSVRYRVSDVRRAQVRPAAKGSV